MDLYEAIEGRHSIRKFTEESVDRAALDRIVHAGAAAPSSMNGQPWRFHVSTGATRQAVGKAVAMSTLHLKEYMGVVDDERMEAAERFFAELGGAPAVVAVSSPVVTDALDALNTYLSIGGAIQNMQLAAHAEGIGCCNITFSFWVRDTLAEILGLPADREIVSLLLMGHSAETPMSSVRNLDVATYHD